MKKFVAACALLLLCTFCKVECEQCTYYEEQNDSIVYTESLGEYCGQDINVIEAKKFAAAKGQEAYTACE